LRPSPIKRANSSSVAPDEKALPERALLDDARHRAGEPAEDRLRDAGRQGHEGRHAILAATNKCFGAEWQVPHRRQSD